MDSEFDVICLGAGPAGEALTRTLAGSGLRLAVIEADLVGGECAYWGCIPSKTLIRPGDVLAAARRVPGAREAVTDRVHAPAALARRDELTSGWDDRSQVEWLEGAGVALVRGVDRTVQLLLDMADPSEISRQLELALFYDRQLNLKTPTST